MAKRKQKYYPNNWRAIKDCPAKWFQSISYEEFEDWKVYGYVLPDSVFCLMRERDIETGKVKERYYNTEYHARRRVQRCMREAKELTVVTMDGVYNVYPNIQPPEQPHEPKELPDSVDYTDT